MFSPPARARYQLSVSIHPRIEGNITLQTVVKKWFRDKEYGFLDNGAGPDILVRKSALQNCHYLKVGASVEFECHIDKRGLVAKNVRLSRRSNVQSGRGQSTVTFGVMQ